MSNDFYTFEDKSTPRYNVLNDPNINSLISDIAANTTQYELTPNYVEQDIKIGSTNNTVPNNNIGNTSPLPTNTISDISDNNNNNIGNAKIVLSIEDSNTIKDNTNKGVVSKV